MRSTAPTASDIAAAIGLAIGGALGLAGTFVDHPAIRESLWMIDGVAIVVATTLLTMKYLRLGHDCVAAGFLTFAAGETLLVGSNAAGLQASVPTYAGGIALWSAGLVMISTSNAFALWMRFTATAAAVMFVIAAARIIWGAPLLPTSAPLPALGYPFLVLTFAGWIWTVLRARA